MAQNPSTPTAPTTPPARKDTPAVKVPPTSPTPSPFARFLGTRVIVTLRGGIIIEGDLCELRANTMTLEGCAVIGTKHQAIVGPLVLFIFDNVSHVHPVATVVTPLATDDPTRERSEPRKPLPPRPEPL